MVGVVCEVGLRLQNNYPDVAGEGVAPPGTSQGQCCVALGHILCTLITCTLSYHSELFGSVYLLQFSRVQVLHVVDSMIYLGAA